jgi:hypothetical protein
LYEKFKSEVLRIFKQYGKQYLPEHVAQRELQFIRIGIDADDRSRG